MNAKNNLLEWIIFSIVASNKIHLVLNCMIIILQAETREINLILQGTSNNLIYIYTEKSNFYLIKGDYLIHQTNINNYLRRNNGVTSKRLDQFVVHLYVSIFNFYHPVMLIRMHI